TRFTFSAAVFCTEASASPATPVASIELTSMCAASQETSSDLMPEIRLTTPAGTSEVCSTSPNVIAGSGFVSDVMTTTVLPPTIAGAMRLTRPRSAGSSGATTPTTPVGSGTVKLYYGPATGFTDPTICGYLSLHTA